MRLSGAFSGNHTRSFSGGVRGKVKRDDPGESRLTQDTAPSVRGSVSWAEESPAKFPGSQNAGGTLRLGLFYFSQKVMCGGRGGRAAGECQEAREEGEEDAAVESLPRT